MIWLAIVLGCVGCYAFKLAGMSVPAAVLARPTVRRLAGLLPVALLAALIGVQTFGAGQHLVIDARLGGVLVAGLAVWRKWPFLVVVAMAAATTALLRWWQPTW